MSPAVRTTDHQTDSPSSSTCDLFAPSHTFTYASLSGNSHINYFFHVCSTLPVSSSILVINYVLTVPWVFNYTVGSAPSVSLSAHLLGIIFPQYPHFKITLSFSYSLNKASDLNLLLFHVLSPWHTTEHWSTSTQRPTPEIINSLLNQLTTTPYLSFYPRSFNLGAREREREK